MMTALQQALAEVEQELQSFESYFVDKGYTREEIAEQLSEIAERLPAGSTVCKMVRARLDEVLAGGDNMH
jgi:hypothetical protein